MIFFGLEKNVFNTTTKASNNNEIKEKVRYF